MKCYTRLLGIEQDEGQVRPPRGENRRKAASKTRSAPDRHAKSSLVTSLYTPIETQCMTTSERLRIVASYCRGLEVLDIGSGEHATDRIGGEDWLHDLLCRV